MADLCSGCVVTLTDARQATVRFIGATHFAVGEWVGIELDEPTGKNDGAVQGERYFNCEPGFGMFVRPSAIATVIQQPARAKPPMKTTTTNAPAVRGRAQSGISGGTGLNRINSISTANPKRHSASPASPSPGPRSAAQRLSLKSPVKPQSPTKQLSTASTPQSGRSSISGQAQSSVAAPKVRSAASKTSMGPPLAPSGVSRTTRTSISGPASRTSRPSLSAPPGSIPSALAKRPVLRPTAPNMTSGEAGAGVSPASEGLDTHSQDGEGDVTEAENALLKVSKPTPGSSRASTTRPAPAPVSSQRHQNQAVARELDEMKTKLRVMEKKRSEDREKLKTLEILQTERDKFEGIIQKLQTKYQPQQLEIGELRKKLKESETRLEEVERLQAEHESLMEMAGLDREMAEETAEAFRHECDALRVKVEELQLEVEVLREENEEFGQVLSPEEKSSHGWLQMEKTNERLREALIRLRDMTQQQESELKDQIKELQQDLEDYAQIKSRYEATKEKLLVSENNVDNLKQQLETALGAEEMIEELADKNMRYQEEINDLTTAIEDLEALKEINDELEYNHVETEKQLQEEIDYHETIFNEQNRKISQQDEVIEDLEYTLVRFRELVSTLQADLEDMRASQQISEAEATDLTARSRAMMDLNLKLQASVSKAQTKTIDIELGRMDAEEAIQHLSILKLYLPEYFDNERNSVLALLRFKRVSFKATLMNNAIREMISEQASISPALEDIFTAHDVLEKLLWIASLCNRFVSHVSNCSAESFIAIQGSLFELEPVERTLNFWLECLKKNELSTKKCAVELQRSIALLTHLAETLLPTSLEAFADELCMRSMLTQSYIDHSASSMARVLSLLQSKLPIPDGGDEEITFLFNKVDTFVSQARGMKVAMGKIYRAVDELRSRSLALSHDAAGSFKQAEDAAKDISSLSRQLGENLVLLVSDESRVEPISLPEVLKFMSQISTLYAQSPETASDSNDAMSFLFTMLRSLGGTLEELGSISSDLSITSEFEKLPSPWIRRSLELRSSKTISPDADEEIRRLKNEIHEASTALGVKDKTIEEQAIKVELVESRMRDASKKAAAVKELESKIEEMKAKESNLEGIIETQLKGLQNLEAERDDIKARFDRVKRASGTAGATTADGVIVDSAISLATLRENEALRAEVESLQAAVRFLREENRRNNILDPYSVQRSTEMYNWLDIPLSQTSATPQQEKIHNTASESRDVFTHLLKLTQESNICDLKSTHNRAGGWRPSKARLRYQVLQQRENFQRWAEWRDDVVTHEREQGRLVTAKKEKLAREGGRQKHVSQNPVFANAPHSRGYGMMGRAWQMLGMEQDGHKPTDKPAEPAIAPTV